ncbi:hypothetical protein TIFTF001_003268 [Ficus carica]|uniref:Uncharacterized protein n=1 Tax=Ficus carica TaxID=3494 RepID=A0AA87Z7A4_FICCA|nr:hypothetical protein TIFTF001_003268 [Ficus carica]
MEREGNRGRDSRVGGGGSMASGNGWERPMSKTGSDLWREREMRLAGWGGEFVASGNG